MTLTEEDRRALAYQAQRERRKAAEQAREQRLAGSPAYATNLTEDWQPLVDFLKERDRPELCDEE